MTLENGDFYTNEAKREVEKGLMVSKRVLL